MICTGICRIPHALDSNGNMLASPTDCWYTRWLLIGCRWWYLIRSTPCCFGTAYHCFTWIKLIPCLARYYPESFIRRLPFEAFRRSSRLSGRLCFSAYSHSGKYLQFPDLC